MVRRVLPARAFATWVVTDPSDPRLPAIRAAADAHRAAGLQSVTGEHYEGGHWLGSFAVYLLSKRGTVVPSDHVR